MASLVGLSAPDFTLRGSDGQDHSLASARGNVTVLFFYVGDNTPTCRKQLVEYNDIYKSLHSSGVRFMGISPDSEETHYAFTCRLDLRFPLLVDNDRAIARQYGVVWPFGIFRRATFVIDADGVVQHAAKTGVGGFLSHRSTQSALDVAQALVQDQPAPAPKPEVKAFDLPFNN